MGGPLKRRGEKFVAVDTGRDAMAAIVRLNTHDAAVAADVDVAGKGDLLGKSEDKFNGTAGQRLRLSEEIQTAIADVASFAVFFDDGCAVGIAEANR